MNKSSIIPYEEGTISGTFDIETTMQQQEENLDLQVSAGTISRDTANTYKRGMEKFYSWLGARTSSNDVIL